MLDIDKAVKEGRYKKNEDGTYTVYGKVKILEGRAATQEDVQKSRENFNEVALGAEIEKV